MPCSAPRVKSNLPSQVSAISPITRCQESAKKFRSLGQPIFASSELCVSQSATTRFHLPMPRLAVKGDKNHCGHAPCGIDAEALQHASATLLGSVDARGLHSPARALHRMAPTRIGGSCGGLLCGFGGTDMRLAIGGISVLEMDGLLQLSSLESAQTVRSRRRAGGRGSLSAKAHPPVFVRFSYVLGTVSDTLAPRVVFVG